MAKIVLSDDAPNEAVHFSLANVEFDLDGGAYESNDPDVLANASAHPWLEVEYEAEEVIGGVVGNPLAPEDDVLSRVNSVAFDPEAIREVEEAKGAAADHRTALDAGKDQDEVVEVRAGDLVIAETLAADKTNEADDESADDTQGEA